MRKTPIILIFLFGVALAANQSLEQILVLLPKSLEWQALDLNFLVAQNNFESAQAAAGVRVTVGADASSTNSTSATTSSYKVNANASLPILPWASQFDDLRKAERTYARAKLDLRDSRNTLLVNTNTQYWNVRIAQLDFELANNTLLLRENQVKTALIQRTNNQITTDQQQSIQQNLETAKISVLHAETTLELAQLTLGNTLDQNEKIVASSQAPIPPALGNLEESIKKAFDNRTDLQKAKYAIQDAEDNLTIAERDRWLPNTSINLGISNSGASLNTGLNLQSGSLSVGGTYQPPSGTPSTGTTISVSASISIPVIAPSNDARITSAKTTLEVTKQNLERTKKSAELDIRQKNLDTQNAIRRIELSKKALENSKNVYNTNQTRYDLGSITKTDLETSKLTVQQAERDLENTIITAHTAWLRLEHSLGKGLTK